MCYPASPCAALVSELKIQMTPSDSHTMLGPLIFHMSDERVKSPLIVLRVPRDKASAVKFMWAKCQISVCILALMTNLFALKHRGFK